MDSRIRDEIWVLTQKVDLDPGPGIRPAVISTCGTSYLSIFQLTKCCIFSPYFVTIYALTSHRTLGGFSYSCSLSQRYSKTGYHSFFKIWSIQSKLCDSDWAISVWILLTCWSLTGWIVFFFLVFRLYLEKQRNNIQCSVLPLKPSIE